MTTRKFTSFQDLLKRFSLNPNEFNKDTYYWVDDEQIVYIFDPNDKEFLPMIGEEKDTAKPQMTLYDLNKAIVAQLPLLTDEQLLEKGLLITENTKNSLYYMLLGREINYYTIFEQWNPSFLSSDFSNMGEAVITCLQDIGDVVDIDFIETTRAFEIWVRTKEQDNICLYLFDCEQMIVIVGEQ